jgi:hypothetical protein
MLHSFYKFKGSKIGKNNLLDCADDASFYHSVASMALMLRRSPCALRPL